MKPTRLPDLLSHALLASLLVVVPASAQSGPEAPAPAGEATASVPSTTPAPAAESASGERVPGDSVNAAQPDAAQAEAPSAPAKEKKGKKSAAPKAPAAAPGSGPQPTATRIQPPADGKGVNVQVMDVNITGDQFDEDPATGNVTVTGNPRAVRGTEEIRATRLIINRRTQQVTAEGNVIIRRGNQEFHASRATYNFPDQSGEANNVKSLFQTVYLDAEQIFFKPGGVYEYRNTKVTTCDQPDPHYLLRTRTVDVIPGERMIVHGARLDLLGVRLFTLPTFEKNLARQDDEKQSLFPTFGYDSHNGPYIRKEFALRQRSPIWLYGDVQLNAFRDPQAGILAATPGKLQFVGSLFYRDVAENQRARHLQVSRLPEVGAVWTNGETPRPGRFLPNQVTGLNVPRNLQASEKWRFGAEVTAGYFIQHRGDDLNRPENTTRDGSRIQAQAQALLPRLRLGPVGLDGLRFMARQSFYNTGESFTLLGTGIGRRFRIGKNFAVGVERFDQWTVGHTPFLFDDVELRQEWRPRLEYHTRGTNIEYYTRLRNGGGVYDHVVSISHLFHCIEPRLTYHARRGEIFLEFRIPGLAGFGRSGAGEPRSVDTQDEQRPATRAPVQSQP